MPQYTRTVPHQTRRDAWVEINLATLESNTRQIRQTVPNHVELMAVIKADAYGHGANMILPTLIGAGVTQVGVSSMDEAITLRQAGHQLPILVIGAVPDWIIQPAMAHNVALTIFEPHHLKAIQQNYNMTGQRVRVHIKVDTGMHRIGIMPEGLPNLIADCLACDGVLVEGVFTHLACADDAIVSAQQLERFNRALEQSKAVTGYQPQWVHVTNTAGSLFYPNVGQNLARVGIGLLGYWGHDYPENASALALLPEEQVPQLQPALSLKARVVHLQSLEASQGVSYGHRYQTTKPSVIATLPLGYADGIPRQLSGNIQGTVRGHAVPQVGNITMDQMMMDVTAVPDVQVGDTVTLIHPEVPLSIALLDNSQWIQPTVAAWAAALETIPYEVMCQLRVRLPKVYTR